jgi:hypothetical protein
MGTNAAPVAHRLEICFTHTAYSRSAWRHIVLLPFRVCADTSGPELFTTGELFIQRKTKTRGGNNA